MSTEALTPKERSATTALARSAFLRRFDDEVDPDRVLDPEHRARLADAVRRR
jgi:hypothetical protein